MKEYGKMMAKVLTVLVVYAIGTFGNFVFKEEEDINDYYSENESEVSGNSSLEDIPDEPPKQLPMINKESAGYNPDNNVVTWRVVVQNPAQPDDNLYPIHFFDSMGEGQTYIDGSLRITASEHAVLEEIEVHDVWVSWQCSDKTGNDTICYEYQTLVDIEELRKGENADSSTNMSVYNMLWVSGTDGTILAYDIRAYQSVGDAMEDGEEKEPKEEPEKEPKEEPEKEPEEEPEKEPEEELGKSQEEKPERGLEEEPEKKTGKKSDTENPNGQPNIQETVYNSETSMDTYETALNSESRMILEKSVLPKTGGLRGSGIMYIIGFVLIAGTLSVNIYNKWRNEKEISSFEKEYETQGETEEMSPEQSGELQNVCENLTQTVSGNTQENHTEKLQEFPIETDVLAILSIPSISCKEIVKEGSSNTVLSKALGHIEGTALPGQPGNCAIAGHRNYSFGLYFNRLNEVAVGDKIIITTKEKDYIYTVAETKVVEPEEISVLDQTKDTRLTLITCTPIYIASHRLIIIAKLETTE